MGQKTAKILTPALMILLTAVFLEYLKFLKWQTFQNILDSMTGTAIVAGASPVDMDKVTVILMISARVIWSVGVIKEMGQKTAKILTPVLMILLTAVFLEYLKCLNGADCCVHKIPKMPKMSKY